MPDSNPARQYDAFVMLDSMIEMQKRVVSSLDLAATRISELTSEGDRLARMSIQIREDTGILRSDIAAQRSDIAAMRADMLSRFEAVGARFDENDRAHERMEDDVRRAMSDVVSQNNDTLNAVQSALQIRIQFAEMIARIEALEQRKQ